MDENAHAELDAAMRNADAYQLDMVQRYGKSDAAEAAKREADRRAALNRKATR